MAQFAGNAHWTEPSLLFAHKARPFPFKCENEYSVLALSSGRFAGSKSKGVGRWAPAATRFIAYAPNFPYPFSRSGVDLKCQVPNFTTFLQPCTWKFSCDLIGQVSKVIKVFVKQNLDVKKGILDVLKHSAFCRPIYSFSNDLAGTANEEPIKNCDLPSRLCSKCYVADILGIDLIMLKKSEICFIHVKKPEISARKLLCFSKKIMLCLRYNMPISTTDYSQSRSPWRCQCHVGGRERSKRWLAGSKRNCPVREWPKNW